MNIKKTVCILTAGVGSRINLYSTYINKSLLPIKKKAAISHIIEKFPKNTEFVIAIGHLGVQVKDFLKITYPEKKFRFVKVKKYVGKNTGPAVSLYTCRRFLQKPFYFVSCDTIWTNKIKFLNKNWMGINKIPIKKNKSYCNIITRNNKIVKLVDKKQVSSNCNQFIGLAFIKDYKIFWNGIKQKIIIKGESQVSKGFNNLIIKNKIYTKKFNWFDIGTTINYKKTLLFFEKYNFNKQNEFIYISGKKVVKFFSDKQKCKRIIKISKLNKKFYQKIKKFSKNFISYDFINGETLYEKNNSIIIKHLLSYLENKFWKLKKNKISKICKEFYKYKTFERIKMYKKKYNFKKDKINYINRKTVDKIENLLKRIEWKKLYSGIPTRIHGDLQFDNILYTHNKKFKLIDYRDNFGGKISLGDKYYDLAKLYGGMILNYNQIKKNKFKYSEKKMIINYLIPKVNEKQINLFYKFVKSKNLDFLKIKLITSLIFLNMAPLHEYPFDKLLFAHGKINLQKNLNEKI